MPSRRHLHGVLRDWIDRCINEGRHLTDWEDRFLESLDDQLRMSGSMSEKQEEILERIYTERVR